MALSKHFDNEVARVVYTVLTRFYAQATKFKAENIATGTFCRVLPTSASQFERWQKAAPVMLHLHAFILQGQQQHQVAMTHHILSSQNEADNTHTGMDSNKWPTGHNPLT